jgi:beta-galactosidase/beta-glucuronidase
VLAKAEQQLHEMIRRDRDKASIVLWSVANETPVTPARIQFLKTLAAKVREQIIFVMPSVRTNSAAVTKRVGS